MRRKNWKAKIFHDIRVSVLSPMLKTKNLEIMEILQNSQNTEIWECIFKNSSRCFSNHINLKMIQPYSQSGTKQFSYNVSNSMLTSQLARYLYLPFPYFLTLSWLSSEFGMFFKHEEKEKYVPICLCFRFLLVVRKKKKNQKKECNFKNFWNAVQMSSISKWSSDIANHVPYFCRLRASDPYRFIKLIPFLLLLLLFNSVLTLKELK